MQSWGQVSLGGGDMWGDLAGKPIQVMSHEMSNLEGGRGEEGKRQRYEPETEGEP